MAHHKLMSDIFKRIAVALLALASIFSAASAQVEIEDAYTEPTISHRPISPVEFYKKPAYRSLSISPNGRYLAMVQDIPYAEAYKHYLERRDEEENSRRSRRTIDLTGQILGDQILIYDFDVGAVIETIRFYEQQLYWTHWANNDRLLASISTSYRLKFGGRNL